MIATFIRGLLLLALPLILPGAISPSVPKVCTLGPEVKEVTLAASFNPLDGLPLWTPSGYVLLVHNPTARRPATKGWVRVYAPDGSEAALIQPAQDLPGLARFSVWGGDVSPSFNTIALCGLGVPADDAPRYSTILVYNLSGKFVRQIPTGSRTNLAIAVDRQGDVWSFSADRKAEEQGDDYPLVAGYSLRGEPVSAVLPRSDLAAGVELGDEGPSLGGRFFFGLTGEGFYMFLPQTQQFVEADLTGKVVTSISPIKPDLVQATEFGQKVVAKYIDGLAMTKSGLVYSFFQEEYATAGGGSIASALLRLDRPAGTWELIGDVASRPQPGRLLGSSDESLVFIAPAREAWKLVTVDVACAD